MAKSQKKKKSARPQQDPRIDTGSGLSPETKREIVSITLMFVGIIVFLILFHLFGQVGESARSVLTFIFGWGSYVFGAALMWLGYMLFFPERYILRWTTYLGFFLMTLLVPILIHLFIAPEVSGSVAQAGGGGGVIGHLIGTSLKQAVSITGALLIVVGLSIITLLALFNTSIRKIRDEVEEEMDEVEETVEEQVSKININMPKVDIKLPTFARRKKEESATEGDSEETQEEKKKDRPSAKLHEPAVMNDRDWQYPSTKLLDNTKYSVESGNVKGNAEVIAKTLSQFGITVAMQDVNVGPTFTQYTLKPAEGTKLSKITNLQDDLALALATHPIRIEAPIPGKSLVGVEVPNKKVAPVRLREILESDQYRSAADRGNLVVALGKDVSGHPAVADISKTPHMLIAGSTGSGKSVCVNTVLVSLLCRYSPKELRLILVDPKRVEMTGYNGIAHLLTPVITDVDKTVNALRWAVNEMEARYKLLADQGARDITGYNKKLDKETPPMPYLVIVIDELADVMIQAAAEVENLIVRIAQMARAVGIHLILATQRPSVNVVTGLIKANVPSRIAFRVASQIDSRTIIDGVGAERLIGKGDMLFMQGDGQKPRRIQGIFVDDKEIKSIIDVVREQQEPQYNDEVIKPQKSQLGSGMANGGGGDVDDDMYQQAYDEVVRSGKASASFLQRRLRIGYARAARLLDLLEEQGVIGMGDGAKAREVLVSNVDEGETASIYEDDWGDEREEG